MKTEHYLVVRKGGSIGQPMYKTHNGLPIMSEHMDKDEAKETAKKWNSCLSKGEKKYYRIHYSVVTIKGN